MTDNCCSIKTQNFGVMTGYAVVYTECSWIQR